MIYSLALCLVDVLLTPSSLFASCRRNILLQTNRSTLPSLTRRKPLIMCQGMSYGGPWGALGMGCECHSGYECMESWVGQWWVQWNVWYGSWCASGLCPLLFILVLEALLHELHTDVLWELVYADDLVLIADSQEEWISKLKVRKASMERRPSSWSLMLAMVS